VEGERIDTAGRVERMGSPFADKYGTDYALRDEVANEALYALFTDDERVRGRCAGGSRDSSAPAPRSGGRSCPRSPTTR
jgi:hypothetical protein